MTKEYIDMLIEERLEGDRQRVAELFVSEEIFDELNSNSKFGDWLHFEPKTYDGDYLIKVGGGFAHYYQEHGRAHPREWFKSLNDAATSFFKVTGYIENT